MNASYDTKLEASFSNHVLPDLEACGVRLVEMRDEGHRGVLAVTLQLPQSADHQLRRHVSTLLADFEERHDLAVVVEPTLLFGVSEAV